MTDVIHMTVLGKKDRAMEKRLGFRDKSFEVNKTNDSVSKKKTAAQKTFLNVENEHEILIVYKVYSI